MRQKTFTNPGTTVDTMVTLLSSLAHFLGWEVTTEGYCKKPGTDLMFYLWGQNSTAGSIFSGNAKHQMVNTRTLVYSPKYLDVIESNGVVAVGIRPEGAAPVYTAIIAENKKGDSAAITPGASSGEWLYFMEDAASGFSYRNPINSNTETAVSIVRTPDIYHGSVFKGLCSITSNPYTISNAKFTIGGKMYQQIGPDSSGGFAVDLTEEPTSNI